MIDTDKNNVITKDELQSFLNVDGENAIIDQIMKETDVNNDGVISIDEFMQNLENLFKKKLK